MAAHQALRQNGAEVLGKVQKDLRMLVAREQVDDALNRFGRIVGMQRTDAQMPGTRQRDSALHRFPVANLANQHHIGRSTHGAAQGTPERLRVQPDFALVDDALLVGVQELDGVFDGKNVIGRGLVAMIHHGGERGALARARSAHHQYQPALVLHELTENGRKTKRFQAGNFGGDVAQHNGRVATLVKQRHAKAAKAGFGDGEVDFQLALEISHLLGSHQTIGRLLHHFRRQHLPVHRK